MNDCAARVWKTRLSTTALFNVTKLEPLYRYVPGTHDRGAHNAVLLVHGFHDSAASMGPMRRWLIARGWNASAVSLSPSDGTATLEDLAKQLANHVSESFSPDQKVDLIGFSMGGLVCRYYVQRLNGATRVDKLITVSSPNHGTWLAALSKKPGCLEMRPGSTFLASLNRDTDSLGGVLYTSIWTPLDLMIVPAWSSRMPVGHEHRFWAAVHPLMILQVGCFRKIENCLSITRASGSESKIS